MRILALDIATATGWARWSRELNRPAAGVQVFKGDIYDKVGQFERWLIGKLVADEITHLFIEQFVLMTQGKTNHETLQQLSTMNVMAGAIARRRNLYFEPVHNATWRKHFIGVSRAPKGQAKPTDWLKAKAVDRCRILGWDIPKHDAAEAAGLLDYARARLDPAYGAYTAELFRSA